MSCLGTTYEHGDGALDNGVGGGQLTILERGIVQQNYVEWSRGLMANR